MAADGWASVIDCSLRDSDFTKLDSQGHPAGDQRTTLINLLRF